jgi:AraC-like DNA-binding protein
MDHFSIAPIHYTRLLTQRMSVAHIGHVPRKRDVVNHAFSTFNFSFILEGQGFYSWQDQQPIAVKAPCVITQWPDMPMHYGPQPGTTWRELYLIYEPSELSTLTQQGYVNPQRRWWPVENISMFHEAVERLIAMSMRLDEMGMADRIDRLAELAITESLLPGPPILSKADRVVLKIKQQLETTWQENHDLDTIARSHGLSPSVFRRIWNQLVGMPPHRYVIECRMTHARQMLAETAMNISEITYAVGYEDPLYFSRLFRKTTGISASLYRRYYRK